jgi:hypothetical protein
VTASKPELQRLPPIEGHEQEADRLLETFNSFCIGTKVLPDYCVQPHEEMCNEMEQCIPDFETDEPSQKKEIYLAPRYSYKTSILVAFVCYVILKYANIRITLGRATHSDSKDTLSKVKQTLVMNPKIREVWGDISVKAPVWSAVSITHPFRTIPNQEPTVTTAGIGIGQTGSHPDLVLLDDLVTEVNYQSAAIIMRTRDWVTSYYAILPPHGSIVVCGTRWAFNDIYQWLMDQDDEAEAEAQELAADLGLPPPPDGRQWRRYIRKAVERDTDGKEMYFFPTKLNAHFLAEQKRALRGELRKWGSWYFQQPYEEGVKLFDKKDILYFDGQTIPTAMSTTLVIEDDSSDQYAPGTEIPVNVSMTVDPAPTSGKRSDPTGIVIDACDYFDNWWILHGEGVRKTPSALADYCIILIVRYGVRTCSIETNQADPEFVSRLQTLLKDGDIDCSIVSYSALQDEAHGERGKDDRIHALNYKFVDHQVWVRRGSQCRDLLNQLDGWPTVDHDDVLDALAMQRHVAQPHFLRTIEDQNDFFEAIEEMDSWGPNGPPRQTEKRGFIPNGCSTGRSSLTLRPRPPAC